MCFIIYTLHTPCQHRQYSNTFLCHTARGTASHEETEYALSKTRFLPDAQSQPVQQEHVTAAADCKKRYPTRPVNTLCNACERSQLKKKAFGDDEPVVASASQRRIFSQPAQTYHPPQQQQQQQPQHQQQQ
ncbi:hypothetical protein GE09DRAFT_1150317, partial [Coniochaeta sp. 2T2.1]